MKGESGNWWKGRSNYCCCRCEGGGVGIRGELYLIMIGAILAPPNVDKLQFMKLDVVPLR